jgi:Xaa-Pro aminopeptidase
MDLAAIQSALRERNIDAWLFYDHHHRDPIAYRVLGLPAGLMVTRRWFYLIPAQGEPVKLVHKIEAGHLDSLPGSKRQYSGWQELFDSLKSVLASYRDIAMQYSPNNIVFTISLVDAGTVELLRGLGKNVVSSADLVAQFEATWSEEQIETHFAARDSVDSIVTASFQEIGRRSRGGGTTEHEIQQWFVEAFRRENLLTDDPPIVAVNSNAGNPHYEPRADHPVPIREGDLVLPGPLGLRQLEVLGERCFKIGKSFSDQGDTIVALRGQRFEFEFGHVSLQPAILVPISVYRRT